LLPILCQKPEFAFGAGFCTSESGTIRFSRQILPSIHSDKGSPQQHVHRTSQPHRQGCRLHRSRMHPPFSVSAGPCSTRTIRGAETDGNRSRAAPPVAAASPPPREVVKTRAATSPSSTTAKKHRPVHPCLRPILRTVSDRTVSGEKVNRYRISRERRGLYSLGRATPAAAGIPSRCRFFSPRRERTVPPADGPPPHPAGSRMVPHP